jgi:hypothetical protein
MVWDYPNTNWSDFDYLIFRNTWDYFEKKLSLIVAWKKIEKLGIKTLNPIGIIKQNKHKFYLREMERQGTHITYRFIDKTNALNLSRLIPAESSFKACIFSRILSNHRFWISDIDKINSQYQSIAAEKNCYYRSSCLKFKPWETSLYFNKNSLMLLIKPADGDFRIQVQFGGKYSLIHPMLL